MARAGRRNDRSVGDSHHCPNCDGTFSRLEHLRRHLRSHTNDRPYICSDCGKTFARMDVLNRHLALHDPKERATSTSRCYPRACISCAAARVRCSRERTCKRCSQRLIKCVYPSDRDLTSLGAGSAETSPLQTNDSEQVEAAREIAGVTLLQPAVPLSQTTVENLSPDGINDSTYQDPCATGYAATAAPHEGPGGLEAFMMGYHHQQALEVMSTNWIPAFHQDFSVTELCGGYGDLADSGNPFFFNPMQTQQLQPATPSFADNLAPTTHNSQEPSLEAQHALPPRSAPSTTHSLNSHNTSIVRNAELSTAPTNTHSSAFGCPKGRYYVGGAGGRAPFQGDRTHSRGRSGSVNDNARTPPSPHATVFTTSDTDSSQIILDDVVTNECLDKIQRGIEAECEMQSIQLDWSMLPSLSQLKELVRLYFQNFNALFPFVSQNHLLAGTELDWILVLAIVTVAATYEHSLRYTPAHSLLPFLLRTVVKGHTDRRDARDSRMQWLPPLAELRPLDSWLELTLLQARVLNLACMVRSGDQALMDCAIQELQRLVQCCRSMSLLSRANPPDPSAASGSDMRQSTAYKEAKIKTGMMIWLLDCMMAYQQHCEPLMRLDDMQASLPLAEAPMQTTTAEDSFTIFDVLDMLHVEKRLPTNLSELSNIFIVYSICRNLEEIFRDKLIHLRSWIPTADVQARTKSVIGNMSWPPPTSLLCSWRNSACDCLDILHWRANSKTAATAGRESSTVLHLHFARLVILTPVSQVQLLAVAWPKGFMNSDNARVNEARHQVLQWAVHDHHKARLAIVHSSAVLWHVRRFSKYSFFEPFAVYIATLVTWAYSQCHQPPEQDGQNPCEDTQGYVSPNVSREAAASVAATSAAPPDGNSSFDRTGSSSPEPSFIQLDRPCDDEIVQAFVRRGFDMSAYMQNIGNIHERGAPRKILLEGKRLLLRGIPAVPSTPSANRQAGIPGLGGEAEVQPVVELEYSYVRVLQELIDKIPVS